MSSDEVQEHEQLRMEREAETRQRHEEAVSAERERQEQLTQQLAAPWERDSAALPKQELTADPLETKRRVEENQFADDPTGKANQEWNRQWYALVNRQAELQRMTDEFEALSERERESLNDRQYYLRNVNERQLVDKCIEQMKSGQNPSWEPESLPNKIQENFKPKPKPRVEFRVGDQDFF